MTRNQPAVSVLIPNYNHATYLEQRIESVLAQTYQDFELILLDDCSADNSIEIINRYRENEKVSHVIINEVNSGTTFKQWAKGIELAKNDWIWIAESDDWCEPTLLQNLVEGITANTCISFCQSIAVKGEKILYYNKSDFFYKTYLGYDFVREKMLRITSISNASQAIFRKDVYYKIDKTFTTYKFSGDWLFWMLIALHGNVFVSGKCLNYFRKHDKDVTSPSLKNGMMYREYIKTVNVLQQHNVVNKNESSNLLILKFNELLWDHRVEEKYVQEISRLYHEELGSRLLNLRTYQIIGNRSFLKVLAYRFLGRQ